MKADSPTSKSASPPVPPVPPARLATPNRAAKCFPLALILVGLLTYLNTLPNTFVFDDVPWVIGNHRLHSLANIGQMLTATNRPVLEFTLAINYALGGENPTGYHALNMVIHILASLVLFGLVRRTLLLPRFADRFNQNAHTLAFAVALLWLVHPLNTQSVSYMIQRGESLVGLCYLFTLYTFLRFATGQGKHWAIAAIAACWIGTGTKEVIATAPLVVLLFDAVFIAKSWREPFAKRAVFYVALFTAWVPIAFSLAAIAQSGPDASAGFALEGKMLSRWTYLLTQPQVIVEVYLRKALLPYPLVLDYGWVPAIPQDTPPEHVARLFLTNVLFQGLFVLALFLVSIWGNICKTWWGLLGASFFLILAPTSSFMPIADIAVEHRMYLPLIPLVVLLVFGVHALLQQATPTQAGRYGLLLAAIVAFAFGTQTILRNFDYRSRITIWDSVTQARPLNARGWHNLAKALEDDGQLDESLRCYQNALNIQPGYTPARFNLGVILMTAGHVDDAIECFQYVVQLKPDEAKAHEYLGLLHVLRKELDAAAASLREAIKADPRLFSSYQNLAAVLIQSGQPTQAVHVMEDAIRRADELGMPSDVLQDFKSRRDRYRAQAVPAPASP